jgi:hypothetical protein
MVRVNVHEEAGEERMMRSLLPGREHWGSRSSKALGRQNLGTSLIDVGGLKMRTANLICNRISARGLKAGIRKGGQLL